MLWALASEQARLQYCAELFFRQSIPTPVTTYAFVLYANLEQSNYRESMRRWAERN